MLQQYQWYRYDNTCEYCRTTKFETYQCTLEKWFQILKDKEKLRTTIRKWIFVNERRKDDSETCRGTKRFISIKSNANESLSHLGIEFSSCTCSSLETSCRGMRIFRKIRFSKQNGFLRRLLSRIKASFKKLFIAPFTENQGSSNHFVASSKFSLVIQYFYFELIIFLITNILIRYFFSFLSSRFT